MTNRVVELLSTDPILLLFLILGLGHMIGVPRVGPLRLGSVAGVLLAGLLLGHFGFESDPSIQSLGFVLFIFSVGYQAGPRFVRAIQRDGRRYLTIAVVVAVSGFALAYGAALMLDFEPGVSAGVLAGALTSTPTLAAADAAVASGDYVPPDGYNADTVRSNMTSAYAITYIFGLVGLILAIRVLPGMLGIDLAQEAEKLERQEAAEGPQAVFSPADIFVRAILIDSDEFTGRPLSELYRSIPIQFTIDKIRRNGEIFEPTLDTVLELGDHVSVVAVITPGSEAALKDRSILPAVRDRELYHYQPETVKICVTRAEAAGQTLAELEIPQRHASFVSCISRMGVDLQLTPSTRLERGDVLELTGPRIGLETLGKRLGHLEREVVETDLRAFSWAIVLGILIGTWTLTIAGVSISLGSAGGLLAMGLVVGYLRSIFPVFGQVPGAVRWVFTELGLLLFMASVGLRGGRGLIETLASSGPALLLAGFVVTLVPLFLAYAVGRKLLGMNPLVLLGAITGAMTSGGALNVINDQSKSTVAGIAYTGAYAFANVLLTVAGTLIILL